MTIEEINNYACQIIAFAGDSKSFSVEAMDCAERGEFAEGLELLVKADESLKQSHTIHTELLVKEARDPGCINATMMLIHASNHLTAAEISRLFAERVLNIYKKESEVKK